MKPHYIITSNTVTVLSKGVPFMVAKDAPRYSDLVDALKAQNWSAVEAIVNASVELHRVLAAFGDVVVYGGHVTFKGKTLHNYLAGLIVEASREGFDLEPMGRFLHNVMQNPDERAQADLYRWCEAGQLPLTEDGYLVAYKIVGSDFMDVYSGQFDHSPGKIVQMPRESCDPDPDRTCSHGLHFCSASYLPHYGVYNADRKVMLVKVNPKDVVAFPTDYNLSKARACRLEVIEEIPAKTAATFFDGHRGWWKPAYQWEDPPEGQLYVIKSDSFGYYKAPGAGYTDNVTEAHRYTHDEAKASINDDDAEILQAPAVVSADEAFAKSRGYTVEGDDEGDWEWFDENGACSPGWFNTAADAWADAAADARLSDDDDDVPTEEISAANSDLRPDLSQPASESLTVNERVERLEEELNLLTSSADALWQRLDAIDEALGLPTDLEPQVARIDRAERQLGLS